MALQQHSWFPSRPAKAASAVALLIFGLAAHAQTLGEALNAPEIPWTASGWSVVTYDGKTAVKASATNTLQYNLETTVTGPTAVSFDYRTVANEDSSTRLNFYIDDVLQVALWGATGWTNQSIYVPAGTHKLRWEFWNGWLGTQENAVYLDQVSFAEPEPVSIGNQPADLTVDTGVWAKFQVSASGTGPLSYQWYFNKLPIETGTNRWIGFAATEAEAGDYFVVASSGMNAVTSQTAVLTVRPLPPFITEQPLSQTNLLSTNVTFSVMATGSTPMQWQWLKGGVPIAFATNSSLTLSNVAAPDFGEYQVVVSNGHGHAASDVAILAPVLEPLFAIHPRSKGAPDGATVQFSASVLSPSTPVWQWFHNGNPISGATSNVLTLTNCRPVLYGDYWAVAANNYGTTTSTVARLSYSPVIIWGSSPVEGAPPEFTNVVALAAGDQHVAALRADGTLAVTGSGFSWGYRPDISDATNLVAIAAGSYHVLGLTAEGEVKQWGSMPTKAPVVYVPPELTNVTALGLGTGAQHGLAVRSDGSVVDWRDRKYMENNPVPAEVTNVVAVAAGAYHSLALRADGTLVAWGNNDDGELNIPRSATNIVAISAGWHSNVALRRDGTVVKWGWNTASLPAETTDIVALASGGYDHLFLKADGKVLSTGSPAPPWASNVVDIAAGGSFGLALVGDGPARISSPPVPRTVSAGDTVDVTARAVGAWPLSYQWYAGDTPIPGGTNWLLTIVNIQPNCSELRLVVTNSLGADTSRVAVVTVLPSAPKAIEQPPFVAAETNGTLHIAASVTGSLPLTYQWRFHGTNLLDSERISGSTTDTLSISGVEYADRGGYSVVASNSYGSVTSSVVTVHFPSTPQKAISEALDTTDAVTLSVVGTNMNWFLQAGTTTDGQDAAQSPIIPLSGFARINMSRQGPGAVAFSWKSGTWSPSDSLTFYLRGAEAAKISGQTQWERRSFVLNPGANTLEWRYTKNSNPNLVQQGAVWVDCLVFGGPEPPAVSVTPASAITNEGGTVTLTAKATGTEPFSFQWRKYGTNVPGQTSATLALGSITAALTPGYYSVVVTNVAGQAISGSVPVLVLPADQRNHPWLTSTPAGALQVNWSVGTLETADSLEGPWVPHPDATSPYVLQIGPGSKFCRVRLE